MATVEMALAEWFQDESPGRVFRTDGCEIVLHSKFLGWGYWTAMVPTDSRYTAWKLLSEGDRSRKFSSWTEAAKEVEAYLKHIKMLTLIEN